MTARRKSLFPLIALPIACFLLALIAACGSASSRELPDNASVTPAPAPTRPSVPPPAALAPTATPLPDRTDCASIRGTDYHSEAERDWYLANCLPTPVPVPVVPAPNPPAIPGPEMPGERWVLIDLATQKASAMIGERVLYTALVTTGKEDWETPPGTFRILYRVANETMTSASIGAEEYYVLKDVLYTQYFTNEGHALHLNYWRPDYYFGNIASSHGCVGMRLADAEFFWRFANVGTRVTIR